MRRAFWGEGAKIETSRSRVEGIVMSQRPLLLDCIGLGDDKSSILWIYDYE